MKSTSVSIITASLMLIATSCGAVESETVRVESSPATSAGGLPTAETWLDEVPYQNLADILSQTDALFSGKLVKVLDDWHTTENQEGDRDEYAGLVFDVKTVIGGTLEDPQVTVALYAYQLDRSSGERVNQVSSGGIELSDFTIGEKIRPHGRSAVAYR